MKIEPPPPEKSHPLFPSNPPLKVEFLSSSPLFENLVEGSTPLQKRGCTLWYLQQITLKVVYTIFTANFWKLIAICDLWWLNSRSELDISIWTLWRSLHQSVHKAGQLLKSQNIYFWNKIQVLRANLNIQLNCSNKLSFHLHKK